LGESDLPFEDCSSVRGGQATSRETDELQSPVKAGKSQASVVSGVSGLLFPGIPAPTYDFARGPESGLKILNSST
jgi:hypothetical protein